VTGPDERHASSARHDDARGPCGRGSAREIGAVEPIASNPDVQLAGTKRARVDRNTGNTRLTVTADDAPRRGRCNPISSQPDF
jgi:hypothetical protein